MALCFVRSRRDLISCRRSFSSPCFRQCRTGLALSTGRSHPANVLTKRRPEVRSCASRRGQEIVEFVNGTAARDDYDAVCVLSGGYQTDGTLPPVVHRRLDLAHSIFVRQPPSCPILCVGGGTPHKPPFLDKEGHVLHESTLLALHLIKLGVDPTRILKEYASYDTVGNAFFTLMNHVIPAQWRRLAIVTSDFHMPRTMTLFTDIFALARPVIVEDEVQLDFFGAADDVLSPAVLRARQQREAESLAMWKKNGAQLKTLATFHQWLHATHRCYSVPRQHEFSDTEVDSTLRRSY